MTFHKKYTIIFNQITYRYMKMLFAPIILGFIIAASWVLTPETNAYYDNYPDYNAEFHPRHPNYYDGNQRLKLKKRADIERATKPNLHYDKNSRDYYRCNWLYNKNLGTWVCEKNTPQPVQVCPFGYTRHPIQQTCTPIRLAANSHLNKRGDGWECNTGYHMNYAGTGCIRNKPVYTYASNNEAPQTEITRYVYVYEGLTSLPSTGAGVSWMIIGSVLGGASYTTSQKIKKNKQQKTRS